jgi:hypothetical protein
MQWRKLLLGFSFYYLMAASVAIIFLFASVVDLNTAGNVFKGKGKALLQVADVQLFLAMVYILAGLFMVIVVKRKAPGLNNRGFAVAYLGHFFLCILPTLAYFVLMIV